MLDLKIIIGSTRDGRAADIVIPWLVATAQDHGGFGVEVLDLRDWPLPMFAETVDTVKEFNDPTYSTPGVKLWNERIGTGDAFLFLTPEYNHSIPGVLKNAIDNVFVSFAFRNKPAAFVGYSGGLAAGVRAVEHLAQIAIETEMVPLRNTVLIPQVQTAFDRGVPSGPRTQASLQVVLDDLEWWGSLLQRARADHELLPGAVRLRNAMTASA